MSDEDLKEALIDFQNKFINEIKRIDLSLYDTHVEGLSTEIEKIQEKLKSLKN